MVAVAKDDLPCSDGHIPWTISKNFVLLFLHICTYSQICEIYVLQKFVLIYVCTYICMYLPEQYFTFCCIHWQQNCLQASTAHGVTMYIIYNYAHSGARGCCSRVLLHIFNKTLSIQFSTYVHYNSHPLLVTGKMQTNGCEHNRLQTL